MKMLQRFKSNNLERDTYKLQVHFRIQEMYIKIKVNNKQLYSTMTMLWKLKLNTTEKDIYKLLIL